jgi:hypothetical protein
MGKLSREAKRRRDPLHTRPPGPRQSPQDAPGRPESWRSRVNARTGLAWGTAAADGGHRPPVGNFPQAVVGGRAT